MNSHECPRINHELLFMNIHGNSWAFVFNNIVAQKLSVFERLAMPDNRYRKKGRRSFGIPHDTPRPFS